MINSSTRPEKRRTRARVMKEEQYKDSKFIPVTSYTPNIPKADITRTQRTNGKPFTPEELEERMIERRRAMNPSFDFLGRPQQHSRESRKGNPNRKIQRLAAKEAYRMGIAKTQNQARVPEYMHSYARNMKAFAEEMNAHA